MSQLNLFPEDSGAQTRILFANFGGADELYALQLLARVREQGFNGEIYPDASKMKKQMAYADKKGIPYVAIVGEQERAQGLVMLKNMASGDQQPVNFEALIKVIASH